jgi:hypothetical protein
MADEQEVFPLDVGSELSEAKIDLTGTIIPPVRQVERVLKVFRELKRSSRAVCETVFRIRSERWQTYVYCKTHCNWLIDTIPTSPQFTIRTRLGISTGGRSRPGALCTTLQDAVPHICQGLCK